MQKIDVMNLRKTILFILFLLTHFVAICQDKTNISFFVYNNSRRIIVDTTQITFTLLCNDTLYNLPVRQEIFDIDNEQKEVLTFLEFPLIEIDSSKKAHLIFRSAKYTITADMSDFFKSNKLMIRPHIILYYYNFNSFRKYEHFCENHNVCARNYEPTQTNFNKWQLFYFIVGHERMPYIPIEIISVERVSK